MNPAAIQIIRELSREMRPVPTSCDPVLPSFPGIRAVIFDVYGTLFISSCGDRRPEEESPREDPLRAILEKYGIPSPSGNRSLTDQLHDLVSREHAVARDQGIRYPEIEIRDLWSELLDQPCGPELEHAALACECITNPVWPMPGASETLVTLHGRGLTLGIVSNAQFYTPLLFPALLDRDLEELGFEEDLCLFSYQHGVAKPGPALYRILRERLDQRGIAPAETLYLGNDAHKDIHPAAELGFHTVLFAGDNRSLRLHSDQTVLHSPDALITNLAQLPDLLVPV